MSQSAFLCLFSFHLLFYLCLSVVVVYPRWDRSDMSLFLHIFEDL